LPDGGKGGSLEGEADEGVDQPDGLWENIVPGLDQKICGRAGHDDVGG
jgi:hypothetical protein